MVLIGLSVHSSIVFCLSEIVLQWQQAWQGVPGLVLACNAFQLLGDVITPLRASLNLCPVGHLQGEPSQRHPDPIPKTPQRAPHPISAKIPSPWPTRIPPTHKFLLPRQLCLQPSWPNDTSFNASSVHQWVFRLPPQQAHVTF